MIIVFISHQISGWFVRQQQIIGSQLSLELERKLLRWYKSPAIVAQGEGKIDVHLGRRERPITEESHSEDESLLLSFRGWVDDKRWTTEV